MGLLQWEAWQRLNALHQYIYDLLQTLCSSMYGSTLWIGDNNSTWISVIQVLETDTEIVLHAEIPSRLANSLMIEVTQETIIIQGEWQRSTEPQDYLDFEFYPGQFQSLIPLPAPIQSQTAIAELKGNRLVVTLQKSWQSRRAVPVTIHNAIAEERWMAEPRLLR
jgi:HSP20 family protein